MMMVVAVVTTVLSPRRASSHEKAGEFFVRQRLNVDFARSGELRVEASFSSATAGNTGAHPSDIVTDRLGESND